MYGKNGLSPKKVHPGVEVGGKTSRTGQRSYKLRNLEQRCMQSTVWQRDET